MREHENTSVRLVGIRTPTPTRLLRNWVHCRSAFHGKYRQFWSSNGHHGPTNLRVVMFSGFSLIRPFLFLPFTAQKYNIIAISSINCFRAAMVRNFQTAPKAKSRKISRKTGNLPNGPYFKWPRANQKGLLRSDVTIAIFLK